MKFKLEEKFWKYTIPAKYGQDIVDAEEDNNAEGIVNGLQTLKSYIEDNIIKDNEDMKDEFEDIKEDIEIKDASDFEGGDYDEVDYILNNIYDFCDAHSIWFEPGK